MESSFKKMSNFTISMSTNQNSTTMSSLKRKTQNLIQSNQKKTIRKEKKGTPSSKTPENQIPTQICRITSDHKRRLEFIEEETPKKMVKKTIETTIKMEDRKKDKMPIFIKKLEFFNEESMEDNELLTVKLIQNNDQIKTEYKIDKCTPLDLWTFNKSIPVVSSIKKPEKTSKLTLNSFNSLKISKENEILDLLDSKTQLQAHQNYLLEYQKDHQCENPEDPSKKICCNCKKSRCLKLYCECFAAQKICQGCNCLNCANLDLNSEERLTVIKSLILRNPNAFKPKLEYQEKEINYDSINTEISIKHTKGCNCKKTGCAKKYCECYQAGIMCGELCKCEGCKNCTTYSIKDEESRSFESLMNGPLKNSKEQELAKITISMFNSLIKKEE